MRRNPRAVTQWLLTTGIVLTAISLFLDPDSGFGFAALKAFLQGGAIGCYLVGVMRLWQSRQRRLRHVAGDDLSTQDPRE